MTSKELAKTLQPLIKKIVKEVLAEELSTIIAESIKSLSQSLLVEAKLPEEEKENYQTQYSKFLNNAKPNAKSTQSISSPSKSTDSQEYRKKLLESIGSTAYKGVDIFEGVKPFHESAHEVTPSSNYSPLKGIDPNDPGIDITQFFKK